MFSAGWWSGNKKYFCFLFRAFYFKAMPNSIDVYKEFFLHVIPVRIIVACFRKINEESFKTSKQRFNETSIKQGSNL